MNNEINMIITGESLAEKISKVLEKHDITHLIMPHCTGFPLRENVLEFIGVREPEKNIIIFKCNQEKHKVILSYILKYHNKKNNGIMFKILEENMDTEIKLFVGIVNAGQGENLAELIRKECQAGATICDARGCGANTKEFLGMRINSNKEMVISAMPTTQANKMKKLIKDNFENIETDITTFTLPITEFNKLHQ